MSARVLVVDDNQENCELLEAILQSRGHIVTTASSGIEALAMLHMDSFDLLLLDIMMPEMDGFETCRRIRQRFSAQQLPIVLVTALTDAEAKQTGIEVGAQGFVSKPLTPTAVVRLVDAFVPQPAARVKTEA